MGGGGRRRRSAGQAYAHWPKINELPYRDAWVLRVATNLAIDKARRRARHTAVPDESIDLHLSDSDADAAVAQLTVLRFTLVAALAKLPRRQREIVVLRHMTGLSEVEVAAATGLALGTVKTHLRRGLMGLRRALGDETGAAVDAN